MRESDQALDAYLAASAQMGDRRALAALFGRWNKRLIAHAWRLTGDTEAAREAAQDGWMEIVRGIGALQDSRAFPAWAYRIVTRRCARAIKAAQTRREIASHAASFTEEAAEDAGPDAAKIRAAVAALPPDQRAAVALFYFEELSVAEAAVALDVPAGTVKTRLMHARRKLREALEGG
jgi:RNA polymerase sigma-70 factor (ECF subfamily)